MFQVFLEFRSHTGKKPIAEIKFDENSNVMDVETDNVSLIPLLKGLATRPMCSIETRGQTTIKVPTKHRFRELLRYIKRPFFFSEPVERIWKYREVIPLA